MWREVLLYQFHDILPGSSIKRVYDECELRYAEMLQKVARMTARSRARVVELARVQKAIFGHRAIAIQAAILAVLAVRVIVGPRSLPVRAPECTTR